MNVKRKSGTKYIPFMEGPDPDRIVVSVCEFQGNLYVATQKGVYILRDDCLERIEMKEKEE